MSLKNITVICIFFIATIIYPIFAYQSEEDTDKIKESENITKILQDKKTIQSIFKNTDSPIYKIISRKITTSSGDTVTSIIQNEQYFKLYVEENEYCIDSAKEITTKSNCNKDSPWIGLSKKQIRFIYTNWDFIGESINHRDGIIRTRDLVKLIRMWIFFN